MQKHLRVAKLITKLLDEQFSLFGFKFGLDPLLGLVPGGGDLIGLILSGYLVWIAWKLEIEGEHIWRMIRNIILDFLLGLIPVIGDGIDFVFKADKLNLEILEKYGSKIIEGQIVKD